MNVRTINGPFPHGSISFSAEQWQRIGKARGAMPDVAESEGIPDFTDAEISMMIEDGGSLVRALQARRYH